MLRRVTWRFWAATAVVLAAYFIAGIWLDGNGRVSTDIYEWGWGALFIAPLLTLGVMSALSRWWRTDVGANLALSIVGLTPMGGIYAWIALVDHGQLQPGALAWASFATPWWTAVWLAWRVFLFMRVRRDKANGHGAKAESQ